MENHISRLNLIWNKLLRTSGIPQRNKWWSGYLLAALLGLFWPLQGGAETEIIVGVLAPRGEARALADWGTTMRQLEADVPGYQFSARPLTLDGLNRAVAEAEVDFVLTNPGQFVLLGTPYALSWLATLRSRQDGSTREALGSVMLVRADTRYREPRELRGQPVAAVHPHAFGGYLLIKPSLEEHGLRSSAFDLRFPGYPIDALLYQLRDGMVEAAIVPVCLLEQMDAEGLIDADRFRVLMEKAPLSGCRSSTPAYPDWTFAALSHVAEALAADVARTLLNSPPDSAVQWGAPISVAQVETLYRRLEVHPLQEPLVERLLTLVWRYWHYSALILLLILAGFIHHAWLQRQANRRARELQAAQQLLREREREIATAQRLNVLGEMASVLAHELNQPLAAIRHYAEGSMLRLERDQPRHPLLQILGNIEEQAERGAEVIRQARQWLQQEAPTPETLPISELLDDVARLHEDRLHAHHISLKLDVEPASLCGCGNRLALEQVLGNLINNSLQAYQASRRRGDILIQARARDGLVELMLQDRAGGFSPEQLEQPFAPLRTTRESGLGLGLLICQRLMKAQGGTLQISNHDGGACIQLTLPREDAK